MQSDGYWQQYQRRVANLFRRIPGAEVQEDVKLKTRHSDRERQIDTLIVFPLKVELGPEFTITVDIKIIVDAKAHERKIDVKEVGALNDLRDDVGAHLAILVSPKGFSPGAKRRASELPIKLLSATNDLLFMLRATKIPYWQGCRVCSNGHICWRQLGKGIRSTTILGSCDQCDSIHVICGDCGAVFGVTDFELGTPLFCPEECGCVYCVFSDRVRFKSSDSLEVWNSLDILLLRAANENLSKRISKGRVESFIEQTKWQYWSAGESPTSKLTERGLMEPTFRRSSNQYLRDFREEQGADQWP